MNKKTVVIGASSNPSRYSYLAVERLLKNGNEVIPIGLRKGIIYGLDIRTGCPKIKDVDTITLYIRASIQKEMYEYMLGLNPKRIIFNPGTENKELEEKANHLGIQTLNACTLVLLATGNY